MQRLKKTKSTGRPINHQSTYSEDQLESIINTWNSKLRSLEGKYTDLVYNWANAARDTRPGSTDQIRQTYTQSALSKYTEFQDQRKSLESDLQHVMTIKKQLAAQRSPRQKAETALEIANTTQTKILKLVMMSSKMSSVERRGKIQTAFQPLLAAIQQVETKASQQKEDDSMKKLEYENGCLNQTIKQLNNEISKLQEKVSLPSGERKLKLLLNRKSNECEELKRALEEAENSKPIKKFHSRNLRLDIESIKQEELKRQLSDLEQSIARVTSPRSQGHHTDRPHTLTSPKHEEEVLSLRQKLSMISRERDMYKSWKENYLKFPPDTQPSLFRNKVYNLCRLIQKYLYNHSPVLRRELEAYIQSCEPCAQEESYGRPCATDRSHSTIQMSSPRFNQTPISIFKRIESPHFGQTPIQFETVQLQTKLAEVTEQLQASEAKYATLETQVKATLTNMTQEKARELQGNLIAIEKTVEGMQSRLSEAASVTSLKLNEIFDSISRPEITLQQDDYQTMVQRLEKATQENLELKNKVENHQTARNLIENLMSENEHLRRSLDVDRVTVPVEAVSRRTKTWTDREMQTVSAFLEDEVIKTFENKYEQVRIENQRLTMLQEHLELKIGLLEEQREELQQQMTQNLSPNAQSGKAFVFDIEEDESKQTEDPRLKAVQEERDTLQKRLSECLRTETELREIIEARDRKLGTLADLEEQALEKGTASLRADLDELRRYLEEVEEANRVLNRQVEVLRQEGDQKQVIHNLQTKIETESQVQIELIDDLTRLQQRYNSDMGEQKEKIISLETELKKARRGPSQLSIPDIVSQDFYGNGSRSYSSINSDELPSDYTYWKKVKFLEIEWWLISSSKGDLSWWRSEQLQAKGHEIPKDRSDDSILSEVRKTLSLGSNVEVPQSIVHLMDHQLLHEKLIDMLVGLLKIIPSEQLSIRQIVQQIVDLLVNKQYIIQTVPFKVWIFREIIGRCCAPKAATTINQLVNRSLQGLLRISMSDIYDYDPERYNRNIRIKNQMEDENENSLLNEIFMLSVNYSTLRRGNEKWTTSTPLNSYAYESASPNNNLIIFGFDVQEKEMMQIQCNDIWLNYYVHDIILRMAIKRRREVFKQWKRLWLLFNPSHVKWISKEVYLKLTEALLIGFGIKFKSKQILKDMKIDFHQKKGMVFSEYYDSIFDLFDNMIDSKQLQDYIELVKAAADIVRDSRWFAVYRPPGRQVQNTRDEFHPWMSQHIEISRPTCQSVTPALNALNQSYQRVWNNCLANSTPESPRPTSGNPRQSNSVGQPAQFALTTINLGDGMPFPSPKTQIITPKTPWPGNSGNNNRKKHGHGRKGSRQDQSYKSGRQTQARTRSRPDALPDLTTVVPTPRRTMGAQSYTTKASRSNKKPIVFY